VNCPQPQLLVISESFHLGWKAMVEGRPQNVYRVNGDFMGCIVGPGKQRVVLTFEPNSLEAGRLASCLGMGLLSVCFLGCLTPRAAVISEG